MNIQIQLVMHHLPVETVRQIPDLYNYFLLLAMPPMRLASRLRFRSAAPSLTVAGRRRPTTISAALSATPAWLFTIPFP